MAIVVTRELRADLKDFGPGDSARVSRRYTRHQPRRVLRRVDSGHGAAGLSGGGTGRVIAAAPRDPMEVLRLC